VELLYQRLIGVEKTRAGYANGKIDYPCYKLICTGATGHAEVVEVTYNPNIITLETIL
jgi:peptide methionine sulfoxide reductase MsrA